MKKIVIIPCHNEAASVAAIAEAARPYADPCFVDDASTDRTLQILQSIPGIHVIPHQRRTHIPGAILDGMRFALDRGYDFAVTMDAGFSHHPDDLPRFFEHNGYDLVIGARQRTTHVPLYRKTISRAATRIVNYGLSSSWHDCKGPGISDCTSGFRMYSKRALRAVLTRPLTSRSFGFHMEALAIVHAMGFTIKEIPITYMFTKSSFNIAALWDGMRVGSELIKKKFDQRNR